MTEKKDDVAYPSSMTLEEAMERRPALKKKVEKLAAAVEHDKKYPLCAKLSSVHEAKGIIEDFLEWAKKGGIELCVPMPGGMGRYYPMVQKQEDLLMKYYKIDPGKLEEERRAIIEEQRKLNER